MRRRAARVDDNQPSIVDDLRKIPGFTVRSLASVGEGFPDIAVGLLGVTGLYEIKDPAKSPSARKLTKDEKKFHTAWTGHARVVETAAEIAVDMRQMAMRIVGRAS